MVVLLALLGLFSALTHKDAPTPESTTTATIAPTASIPPVHPQAAVLGVYAPATTPSQTIAARASTPPDAQREAIKQHPALGVAGSPFNDAFLRLYNRCRSERPAYFNDPSWPVHLADEVASTHAVAPLTPSQPRFDPDFFIGITEAELVRRLGRPLSVETNQSPDGPFKMLKYGGPAGQDTFFVIFASDGTVNNGMYRGTSFRAR